MNIFNPTPLKWHFPDLDNGESDGFNDPILNYFEGRYERYVAREAIQNSIDARVDNSLNPVLVEFEYFQIDPKEIPGSEELKERLNACLSRSTKNNDEKALRFFNKALNFLNQKIVPVLRIGDYATKGLQGQDDEETGSWYKLVKAIGENRMTGAGGGSFGIGKGAPIAASSIHTVYYSTQNTQGESIFQGRSRLITHDYNGAKKRGSGFYGINGYQSIRGEKNIPARFARKTLGTDIYVIAYEPENKNWKEEMIRSVLENFWMAIRSKDLMVKFIEGKTEIGIDHKTLEKMLRDYLPDDTYQYYLTVEKPTRDEEKQLPILGSCHLYLRQDNDLKSKRDVMMMRMPKMLVFKRNFRTMNDGFAGVFICNDPEGNKILRDMEPPKHDQWDPSLAPDKDTAKKGLSAIYDWVKDVLKELASTDTGDPQEIPDLDQFLPLEEGEGKGLAYDDTLIWKSQQEESPKEIGLESEEYEDEIEDVVQRFNAIKKTTGTVPTTTFNGNGNKGDGGSIQNKEGNSGEEEGEVFTRVNTDGIKYRIAAGRNNDGNLEYLLIINPTTDQEGSINIVAVGDDTNYPMELEKAVDMSKGAEIPIDGSKIIGLKLTKGNNLKIKLMLKHPKTKYALGIESYEG